MSSDNDQGVEMKKLLTLTAAAAIAAWFFTRHQRGKALFGQLHGKATRLGAININAQEGVVQLRGELPSQDLIDALVERAQKIQGVREVENLLHTPGTEAPMHH